LIGGTLLVMGATATGWARFTPPAECKTSMTPEQEIEEGQKVAAQVMQKMPILPDSDPVSQYVKALGMKLAARAPGRQWPYTFHVVATSDINAFALPGGPIFVNMGTIQAAQNEAQLAGVIAHEISHVVLRHASCNMAKQKKKGAFYGLGSAASTVALGNSSSGQLTQKSLGTLQSLDYLHMSRGDKKQADLLGVDTLFDLGYDARGMSQFFETIQAKYGPGKSQVLSDHPNPGNRVEYVTTEIESLGPQEHPIVTTPEFTKMHDLAVKNYVAK